MKTTLYTIVGIGLALIIAFAVRSTRQISQGKTALATLSAQREDLQKKAGGLGSRLQNAKTALVALEQKAVAADGFPRDTKAGEVGASDGRQSTAGNTDRRVNVLTVIANDTQKTAEHLKNIRASVEVDYGPAFRAISASREQIEKFKDVEVALEQMRLDIQAAVDLHGLDSNSEEYKKLWAEYNDARLTKKAEVLGELTGRYLDYYRSESVRGYARQLAWVGLATGEMATATQIDQAGDILAANSQRKSTDSYPGWTDARTINWPMASEQLKTVLSPGQIEYIRLQIESGNLNAKINERTKLLTAQFKKQSAAK